MTVQNNSDHQNNTNNNNNNNINNNNNNPSRLHHYKQQVFENSLSFKSIVVQQTNPTLDLSPGGGGGDDRRHDAFDGKSGHVIKHKPIPALSLPEPSVMFSPRPVSELDAAAVKLQKVYKSYRTRRNLADCAVVIEELW